MPPHLYTACFTKHPKRLIQNTKSSNHSSTKTTKRTPPTHTTIRTPKTPLHVQNNHILYPIHSIIHDRSHAYMDKNNITKTYTSHLCQWRIPNELVYAKWLSQRALFPWENQNTINHNILLLTQYYTHKQHQYYTNFLNENFDAPQIRDTRHISPPLITPLCQINITECNPDIDIAHAQPTIQSQHDYSHIYDEDGRHLITVPDQRLQWLWEQYHTAIHQPHNLEPPIQSFEREVAWLYHRYKYKIPKNDTLPNDILTHILDSFHITHSHFSSPITCPTSLRQFSSLFPRDKVFGSIGTAFQHKWLGNEYAHPHTETDAQQALHWARLAAQNDPESITILITTDPNWYHNPHPHEGPFSDSHVITHFKAYTITYDEPTMPPELRIEPRTESQDIHILCIHHKTSPPDMREYARRMYTLGTILQIPSMFATTIPPTPLNTFVNRSKTWSQLPYMSSTSTTPIINIPTLQNSNICLPLKYPSQYCYYTDGSFTPPPKPSPQNNGLAKKRDMGYTILSKI